MNEESTVFFQYLFSILPSEKQKKLYKEAVQIKISSCNSAEMNTLAQCIRFPFLLPFVDACLGFFFPEHTIRKRLIIAFSLIETDKNSSSFFQPKKFLFSEFIGLLLRGIQTILFAILGRIILLFI